MSKYDISSIVYALVAFGGPTLRYEKDGAFYKVFFGRAPDETVVGWITKDEVDTLVSNGVLTRSDITQTEDSQ